MRERLKRLRYEPYRLFFPLGILLGLGGVGHWLFYGLGWMGQYYGFLHANIQVLLYLPCFASGFLMTMMPRSTGTSSASVWELSLALGSLTAVALALFFGQWAAAEMFYVLWLVSLLRFVAVRFRKRSAPYVPVEFVWIPAAVLLGMAGAVALVLALTERLAPEWMRMGRSMQEQGFMSALVVGVGGLLGPRLMGIHPVSPTDPRSFRSLIQKKLLVHIGSACLLLGSFFLEGDQGDLSGYGLRAAVVTGMFLWTRTLNGRFFTGPTLFVRLLSLSFWMISSGYWLVVLFPALRVAALHFVFLGGFSLMIYCVSTMVVVNHAGRGDLLQRPLWIVRWIAAGIGVSLSVRVVATFFGEWYFLLLGISSTAWLLIGLAWLFFYFRLQNTASSVAEDPACR